MSLFVLTKVHVTVSPALSSIEPGELPSLQVAEVSVQPSGVVSVTEYVHDERSPITCWSPSDSENVRLCGAWLGPAAKSKFVLSPSGIVCFSTMIVPELLD